MGLINKTSSMFRGFVGTTKKSSSGKRRKRTKTKRRTTKKRKLKFGSPAWRKKYLRKRKKR